MLHNIIAGIVVGVGALGAAALSPFIGHNASTTRGGDEHRKPVAGIASTSIPCVVSAVAARESSLDSAQTTFTGAINAAYAARAGALAQAYTATSAADIRTATKAAWSAFTSSTKSAGKTWRGAQQSVWKQFNTAIKACGSGSTSVTDQSNAGLEVSGN